MSVPDENSLPWMATEFGYVWMGYDECTQEDLDAFYAAMKETIMGDKKPATDRWSFPGRYNPFYTAKIWIRGTTTTPKMGGLGSQTYELQKVGAGVGFREEGEGAIFHMDPDGNYVHGVLDYPRTGRAFHTDDYHTTWAGPKPGSEAAEWLGDDGRYYWEDEYQWWAIDK